MTRFTQPLDLLGGNRRVSLRARVSRARDIDDVIELFDHSDADTLVYCVAAVALSLSYLRLDSGGDARTFTPVLPSHVV